MARGLFPLWAWLGLALLGPGLGDPYASVSGDVVDEADPVSGATVRLRGTDRSTETGADGGFALEAQPPGRLRSSPGPTATTWPLPR